MDVFTPLKFGDNQPQPKNESGVSGVRRLPHSRYNQVQVFPIHDARL